MKSSDTSFGMLIKKHTLKISALVLSLSLVGGTAVFALAEKFSGDTPAVTAEAETAANESIKDEINSILDNLNADKQETVYVIAKADGTVKKIIVSELLKNPDGKEKLSDKTDLKDIENVKNNNGYTLSGDSYIWDAEGDDVYYQGTSDKQLPVDLSIDFKLNGKEISPDALAGKSGKLEITFNYQNNEKKTVMIDDEEATVYVPFMMMSGLILDNDKASNIEVSNGRILSDGNRSIALGVALPGLSESLDISDDDFEIPKQVTVTADVKDFELSTTLTLATNDVFNALDLDKLDEYDDIKDKIDLLQSSAKELTNGSDKLYNGVATLLDKSGELVNGVQALAIGAEALANGTNELLSGTNELNKGAGKLQSGSGSLDSGIAQLYSGLGKLSGNSDTLNDGAKQVFEALLNTANTQLAASGLDVPTLNIDNYSAVLDSILETLDESAIKQLAYNTALSTVTEKVNENEAAIRAGVEAAVKQKVLEGVLKAFNMTTEQYQQALAAGIITEEQSAAFDSAVAQQMATDTVQAQIDAAVEQQKQALIDENMNSDEVQSEINNALEKAKSGENSIKTLKAQLDNYNEFYNGLAQYTAGVDEAYSGSKQLKDGSAQLKNGTDELLSGTSELNDGVVKLNDGAKELLSGVLQLNDGSVALIDGISQLKDGSGELKDGMNKFYDEGISKISDIFGDSIDKFIARLRATVDYSKEYDSYGGKADGMSSSTKFIYRTDAISK